MDIQKKQMDTEMKEPEYAVPDPSTVMRMKENEAYDTFSNRPQLLPTLTLAHELLLQSLRTHAI